MIPILYATISEGTVPSDYGLGSLTDALSCIVTEERNGSYELVMEYAAGTPLKSTRGREEVSLSPCGIFAPCMPLQGLWFTLIAPAPPSSRRTTSRSTAWFRTCDTRCSVVKIQCRKCVPSILGTFLRVN